MDRSKLRGSVDGLSVDGRRTLIAMGRPPLSPQRFGALAPTPTPVAFGSSINGSGRSPSNDGSASTSAGGSGGGAGASGGSSSDGAGGGVSSDPSPSFSVTATGISVKAASRNTSANGGNSSNSSSSSSGGGGSSSSSSNGGGTAAMAGSGRSARFGSTTGNSSGGGDATAGSSPAATTMNAVTTDSASGAIMRSRSMPARRTSRRGGSIALAGSSIISSSSGSGGGGSSGAGGGGGAGGGAGSGAAPPRLEADHCLVGTAIAVDTRRKLLSSVGSHYLARLRTARSRYMEDHKSDAGSSMGTAFQPSLSDLLIVGTPAVVLERKLGSVEEAPPSTPVDIETETERLSGRALEVEAVLRLDFGGAGAMEKAAQTVREQLEFMQELRRIAQTGEWLMGAIFQELLARRATSNGGGAGGGAGGAAGAGVGAEGGMDTRAGFSNAMSVHRSRQVGRVALETVVAGDDIPKLGESAAALCAVVRIKLEDDNDLGLALTVLEDSDEFFKAVTRLAKVVGEPPEALFTRLREG